MKKLFVTMLAALTAVSIFALDPLTRDGQFNVKKNKGAVAVFSLNWENTQVGNIDDGVFVKGSMPIAEWLAAQDAQKIADGKPEDANYVKDWDGIKAESDKYFKDLWNDEFAKKGLRLTHNESEAQYRFDIDIEGLDWGSTAGSIFGWGNAGGAIIMGKAVISDIATGATIATYHINHVQGSGHVTDRFRIMFVLHQLIDEFDDLK